MSIGVVTWKFSFQAVDQLVVFDGLCIRVSDLLVEIARRTGHAQTSSIRLRVFREDGATEMRGHEQVARGSRVLVKRSPRFDKPKPLTARDVSTREFPKGVQKRRGIPTSLLARFVH